MEKKTVTKKYHDQKLRAAYMEGFKAGRRVGRKELEQQLRLLLGVEDCVESAVCGHESTYHEGEQ